MPRSPARHNVPVEGQLVFNEIFLVLKAAKQGLGLVCLPEDHVQEAVDSGELVRVLDDWCPPFPGYHLYYSSRQQRSAAFVLLVEALRYRV
jgi:DNA-binding transcriptional LysR family regulator